MKRGGILNPTLNRILAETGHTDLLTICDRGFPVPMGIERLDLALTDGIPTVLDTVRAIYGEFLIDSVIVTEEMRKASPERYRELTEALPDVAFRIVSHQQFKDICVESRAVIRTGDTIPYANIMIVSG
ncbi:D-ribose pyranase [Paenibacillus baimaensis]|uniref:D-ribose pyranase n=1 Tax=Paenibacillus baimaensis TaxID=2982185 RepID=UPI0021CF2CAE|nr:D-ribose pyranase [Paenibacillus sp. WQ 127069]